MISIIIPCFNVESYLYRCFNSIKEQTYRDFEVIFIDDGSKDTTADILKNIKNDNKDLSIITHFQENLGVSAARNVGIGLSKGEYLAFIDADDYIYPEFLETLHKGIAFADLQVVGIGGKGFTKPSKPFTGLIKKVNFVYEFWLTRHLWGSVLNKLYSREIILKHGLTFDTELKIMEDMFFNMVYCRYIDNIYVSNKILYNYSFNTESTMHSKFSEKNMNVIETFDKLLSLPFSREDKKIIELHKINSLMWLLRTLYKDGSSKEIKEYEGQIFYELEYADKKLFLMKGWKKGCFRYITFLIYLLNPVVYKYAVRAAYKLRSKIYTDKKVGMPSRYKKSELGKTNE